MTVPLAHGLSFMATALKAAVFAVSANFLRQRRLHGGLDHLSLLRRGLHDVRRQPDRHRAEQPETMLAASGIVHTGYLLIALVAINTETFTGGAILFYLAAYAVSTLGIFVALSYLGAGRSGGTPSMISAVWPRSGRIRPRPSPFFCCRWPASRRPPDYGQVLYHRRRF